MSPLRLIATRAGQRQMGNQTSARHCRRQGFGLAIEDNLNISGSFPEDQAGDAGRWNAARIPSMRRLALREPAVALALHRHLFV